MKRISCMKAVCMTLAAATLLGTGTLCAAAEEEPQQSSLPAAYSSRDLGYVTSVKSQHYSSCWAFASMATLESALLRSGYAAEDMSTDQPVRQMAAEIIREKVLRTVDKEIPHGVAVVIEEFKEDGDLTRIRAEIFCEKESHKGIIVGKGGEGLKRIGSYARADLEKLLDTKVYLNLWVKVKENWRESAKTVTNFGYHDD